MDGMTINHIPSGNLTQLLKDPPFLMGKSTMNGHFQQLFVKLPEGRGFLLAPSRLKRSPSPPRRPHHYPAQLRAIRRRRLPGPRDPADPAEALFVVFLKGMISPSNGSDTMGNSIGIYWNTLRSMATEKQRNMMKPWILPMADLCLITVYGGFPKLGEPQIETHGLGDPA